MCYHPRGEVVIWEVMYIIMRQRSGVGLRDLNPLSLTPVLDLRGIDTRLTQSTFGTGKLITDSTKFVKEKYETFKLSVL